MIHFSLVKEETQCVFLKNNLFFFDFVSYLSNVGLAWKPWRVKRTYLFVMRAIENPNFDSLSRNLLRPSWALLLSAWRVTLFNCIVHFRQLVKFDMFTLFHLKACTLWLWFFWAQVGPLIPSLAQGSSFSAYTLHNSTFTHRWKKFLCLQFSFVFFFLLSLFSFLLPFGFCPHSAQPYSE